jgi:hypothetical protein
MGMNFVTQNGTKECCQESCTDVAETEATCTEEKPKRGIKRFFNWIRLVVGLLTKSVMKGVIISIVLGTLAGLAIGIGGRIYNIDQSTLLMAGVATGYACGFIAMIYVIVSGVKGVRNIANG